MHGAGIVFELHLDRGGAHARHLPRALLRARAEPGRPPRQPAEQAEPGQAERNGYPELSAHAEKGGARKRDDAARKLQHGGELVRIGLDEALEQPHQQEQRQDADEDRRHGLYLIWASSLCAPALRR